MSMSCRSVGMTQIGKITGFDIFVDRFGQFFGDHLEPFVALDLSQGLRVPRPSVMHAFVDRRMNVLRTINTQQRQIVAAAHSVVADLQIRPFACGGDRVHCRNRRRVVDDAFEMLGQIHHLPQPIEHDILKLGRRGRRSPEHRLHIERGGRASRQKRRPRWSMSKTGRENSDGSNA